MPGIRVQLLDLGPLTPPPDRTPTLGVSSKHLFFYTSAFFFQILEGSEENPCLPVFDNFLNSNPNGMFVGFQDSKTYLIVFFLLVPRNLWCSLCMNLGWKVDIFVNTAKNPYEIGGKINLNAKQIQSGDTTMFCSCFESPKILFLGLCPSIKV